MKSNAAITTFLFSCAFIAITEWPAVGAEPALTIYNQNFAVVRDTVTLDLKAGLTETRFAGVTAQVEPDSVILRDPSGRQSLQILEQNYRNDPVTQELLLWLNEGKTIDFENVREKDNSQTNEIIRGKIIRSGYVPHDQENPGQGQPIIEVDGKLRFTLPGQPLFPTLGDDTILKPTLTWLIESSQAGRIEAEVAYITGGLDWHADYNLVSPETGDTLDLIGWITMNNQSGKSFQNAKIKLMAGDVNKIQPNRNMMTRAFAGVAAPGMMAPPVTEKTFDEYHLYTLERRTTLRDRQLQQVEFVRGAGIKSESIYIYDGAKIDGIRYRGMGGDNVIQDREYGTQSNPKVWVMREFANSASNHLGLPLPKGRLRFYRRDADGQMEFTGEDTIDHTPRDEMVRVNTGNSFDLVGERKRTDYKMNSREKTIDESFEIKLRNHKKEPVEIRVCEHLYRWSGWEITAKSDAFVKTDAQTIEFRVPVKPDEERPLSYTVHYSW